MGIVEDIRSQADDILGIRDELGAQKRLVSFVRRVWDGGQIGRGDATDEVTQMLPSPLVREFKHQLSIQEGGAVRQGDILLKSISQQSYPDESDLNSYAEAPAGELLYDVGGNLYRPIMVERRYVTWEVLLRPLNDQRRYDPPPSPEP